MTVSGAAASSIVLRGHEESISAIAFSPDRHWLATHGGDATQLWNLTAPAPAATPVVLRGHEEPTSAVAFSLDGRWLPIARRIVEQHRGEMRVQSQLDEKITSSPTYPCTSRRDAPGATKPQ